MLILLIMQWCLGILTPALKINDSSSIPSSTTWKKTSKTQNQTLCIWLIVLTKTEQNVLKKLNDVETTSSDWSYS